MRRRPPSYRAYLLRVWTLADDGGVRASIRDVGSGETHAFTDLARLTDWLNDEPRTTPSRPEGSTPQDQSNGIPLGVVLADQHGPEAADRGPEPQDPSV
jgi:hypothetical protein